MTSLEKHTAAGQALGYYFQLERALSWISHTPAGTFIGIETEDDVVIELSNGNKILEQDKSSTNSHPFVPSKPDLWKTLNIWLDALQNNEIDINKTTLYLVTNKPSKNSLAKDLSDATSDSQIDSCIKTLIEKAKTLKGEVKQLADKVLSYRNTLLPNLIKKINYESGEGLFGEELRRKLYSDLQLDMSAEDINNSIVNELLGWMFNITTKSWREKQPACISRDDFMREKMTIITSHRQKAIDNIVIEIGQIPQSQTKNEWNNNYVKQLECIGFKNDRILKAIHDYLNAVAKRTEMAYSGYLTYQQIEELDKSLEERWNNIFAGNHLKNKNLSDEELGQVCYYETMNCDTSIAGYQLRNHFITRGTYHKLSNDLKVGWHPLFKNILSEENIPQK